MSKGWLIEGLRDAKREADARPELRERVAAHPSGFLDELRAGEPTDRGSGSSECDHSDLSLVVA
jgi:hypothetical protein